MAFSPEYIKAGVNSRETHAFIQTATYPPFTKGTNTTTSNSRRQLAAAVAVAIVVSTNNIHIRSISISSSRWQQELQ